MLAFSFTLKQSVLGHSGLRSYACRSDRALLRSAQAAQPPVLSKLAEAQRHLYRPEHSAADPGWLAADQALANTPDTMKTSGELQYQEGVRDYIFIIIIVQLN